MLYPPEGLCLLGLLSPSSSSELFNLPLQQIHFARMFIVICSSSLSFLFAYCLPQPPKVSVYSLGSSGTHYVEQVGLSASSAEIKGMHQHSYNLAFTYNANSGFCYVSACASSIFPFQSAYLQGDRQNADKRRLFLPCEIDYTLREFVHRLLKTMSQMSK